MSESDMINGEVGNVKESSPPRPQRKLRLNRRGFHLTNNPLFDLLPDKPVQKNSSINGCTDGSDKNKDAPQKRIISLSSVKNSTSERKPVKARESGTIILKKSSTSPSVNKRESAADTEVSGSDPPAKKKHKPITWP